MVKEISSNPALHLTLDAHLRRKGGLCAVRLTIREPLALCTNDGLGRALLVLDTKRRAVVVAEIELRQVPMQVLLRAMLVGPAHAALEHREVAFHGICMDLAARPFLCAMVDALVAGDVPL